MALQYGTPFSCSECKQHTFETDSPVETAMDFAKAHCTNCGRELSEHDILSQIKTIPDTAVAKMLEDAADIQRRFQ